MIYTKQQTDKMTVAIIIPAFNEQDTIRSVCKANAKLGQLIVINDGSNDMTGQFATDVGAEVLFHPINLGYDQAIQTGLKWAAKAGYEYAVTTDADGQLSSEAVSKVVYALKKGADLVVGKRQKYQRLSEYIFSFISRQLWGIDDPLCGLKGYKLAHINEMQRLPDYDSVGTFFMIRICRLRASNIHQFDVIVKPRQSASRFGSSLSAEIKILRAMLGGILVSLLSKNAQGPS